MAPDRGFSTMFRIRIVFPIRRPCPRGQLVAAVPYRTGGGGDGATCPTGRCWSCRSTSASSCRRPLVDDNAAAKPMVGEIMKAFERLGIDAAKDLDRIVLGCRRTTAVLRRPSSSCTAGSTRTGFGLGSKTGPSGKGTSKSSTKAGPPFINADCRRRGPESKDRPAGKFFLLTA